MFPLRARLCRGMAGLGLLCACSLTVAQGQTTSTSYPGKERLADLSLEQLGNTEVTSASKEPEEIWKSPTAIFVISQDDIRRSGATNLPDVLRLAPGVEVAQIDSNTWSIGIRGFEGRLSRAVLLLIDGRSVYTPLFAGVYWEVQDTLLEDVERIEVIRGPGGTIWGANAVNGVINIITKKATNTHGALAAAGGGNVEQGFLNSRYGAGDDRFSYRIYAKGFSRGPQFHPDGLNFDRWGMGQGGFRTDWAPNDRDAITVQGDAYGSANGVIGAISTYAPPATSVVQANGYFFGQDLVAHWRHQLPSGSDFQLQAYYDRTDRHDIDFREIRNTMDVDFIHHWKPGRNDFIWGAGARISPSDFIQTVPTLNFTARHEVYNIYSGFAQDEITILPDRLTLTLGTKLEHNSYSGFEVQPSGRLLWTPAAHETVWAAITRAVRTPSRIEEGLRDTVLANPNIPAYYRVVGDGDFSSEQLVGYELGFRSSFTSNFYVAIAAFYNQYDNLLSIESGSSFVSSAPLPTHVILPFYLRNGVEGDTRGIEIAPVWQPKSWWRLRGSYSLVHLNMRDQPTSNDASTVTQLEGDSPQHNVRLESSFDLFKAWDLDINYRYVSRIPDQRVPSYSTADTRLGWRLNRQFEFSAVGQNLLQPHHVEYGGDPGPLVGIKRSFYGKITFHDAR
jgi:iron complex outermembrane receptor protein